MPRKQRHNQQTEWLLKAMEMAFAKGKGLFSHSLLDALEGLTVEQAAWKAAGPQPQQKGAHSIWEIVNHATYWKDWAVQRLDGKTTTFSDEASWLVKEEVSEEAWAKAVARLKRTHNALMRRLWEKKLDLDKPFPGEKMPTGEALYGTLAHDCYHTGQILTLRQMQGVGL